MSDYSDAHGSHSASLRDDGVFLTCVRGRATLEMVRTWEQEWEGVGARGRGLWLFDAMRVTGYSPDAVAHVTRMMSRLKAHGLTTIVVATRSTLVKMAATIVKKGLRATTGVEVHIFDDMALAEDWLSRLTA